MDKKWQKPYAFGSTTTQKGVCHVESRFARAVAVVFSGFATAMTRPTFQRFGIIALGAILCRGRRTITRITWLMKLYAKGDMSDFHRVFSRAPWEPSDLAKVLILMILDWVSDEWVKVAIDDTTVLHKGKHVYGKGCHRDAARSTNSETTYKYGHKWVVLAIVVRLPFTSRPWALPILAALARSKKQDDKEGRRHKTTGDIVHILMRRLMALFPDRKFDFWEMAAMLRTSSHRWRAASDINTGPS